MRLPPIVAIPLASLLFAACGPRTEVAQPVEEREDRLAEGRAEATEGEETRAAEEDDDAPPARPADGEVELVRASRPIMGTVFQLTAAGTDEATARPALERALDEIDRLEDVLSEWQDDSEISRLNQQAGGDAVALGEDALAVVNAGLEVSEWSGGAFDLSWAALRGLYLFQRGREVVPPIERVRERLALVSWEQIEREGNRVRLAREGMAIGTGGIGKGYALDRAAAVLRDAGLESFMLFGGGQVQVNGLRGDRGWRVGIQHPRDPRQYVGFLEISGGSISTSGDYEHAFVDDQGRHWHHIIDLQTGLPARRSMQVTLLAAEGVYADALSTACFVLGPEGCIEMLGRVPGEPQAVIVDPELRMHFTPGTRERVVWRVELDEDDRLPGDPAYGGWMR
jgi:thiamine biosynthesis lipoprotein